MGLRIWILLSCFTYVWPVLAQDSSHKDLAPYRWFGGLTKMDGNNKLVANGLATRVQLYKNSAFLCLPRLKPGSEATLVKMCLDSHMSKDKSCMEPYPLWKPQTIGDCDCLQSAVDLCLDSMDILWVLDVGMAYTAVNQPPQRCPPKIFGINVHTDKIEKVINLGSLVEFNSRPQFIVADYSDEGNCFLYVSDAGTQSFIVWDVAANNGYRAVLPHNIINEHAPRDVLYMSLIKKQNNNLSNNLLYFTYRSGENMFCIETKNLQKDASTAKSWDVGKKPGKMIILGTDDWDCIYARFENTHNIFKWNTSTEFTENNFQVVHTGGQNNLIPTHCVPDYGQGVMKALETNIRRYLNPAEPASEAENCLTVMQVS